MTDPAQTQTKRHGRPKGKVSGTDNKGRTGYPVRPLEKVGQSLPSFMRVSDGG